MPRLIAYFVDRRVMHRRGGSSAAARSTRTDRRAARARREIADASTASSWGGQPTRPLGLPRQTPLGSVRNRAPQLPAIIILTTTVG
jgi:hypothetical protein